MVWDIPLSYGIAQGYTDPIGYPRIVPSHGISQTDPIQTGIGRDLRASYHPIPFHIFSVRIRGSERLELLGIPQRKGAESD